MSMKRITHQLINLQGSFKHNCVCVRFLHIHNKCNHEQTLASKMYSITTPIYYVNAAPHIGHLYSCLLADASARWHKIKGSKTFFTTGTDEHGLKIQRAAAASKLDPKTFCDQVSHKFKSVFDTADISYNRFIRTTEADHHEAVIAFWNRLKERGHIYKGSYSGWYSVSDEAFLSEGDVEDKCLPDGSTIKVSKASGHVVTWSEENNYLFKLSDLQQNLLHWLNSQKPIFPQQFESSVRQMLQFLPDLSLTRDRIRLSWGIPVPGDESQTIYVWLDALVNYLTVTGYPKAGWFPWPPDCQIIGKDILRFHAIYWPAFLIAAGFDPPKRLVVHSHWLVDNVKMSKSLGNVIDPMCKMAAMGVDGLRYFLLKEGSLDSDCSYSDKRLAEKINSDLANTMGNLLGRLTADSVNKRQEFPALNEDDLFEFCSAEERDMHKALYQLPGKADQLYTEFHFSRALDEIMGHLHWANALVQNHSPWQLCKSEEPQDHAHLLLTLHIAMETLRVCGILLQPVIPNLSDKLLTRLGVPSTERNFENSLIAAINGFQSLGQKIILQKKVDIN